jgi:hypothetical protein
MPDVLKVVGASSLGCFGLAAIVGGVLVVAAALVLFLAARGCGAVVERNEMTAALALDFAPTRAGDYLEGTLTVENHSPRRVASFRGYVVGRDRDGAVVYRASLEGFPVEASARERRAVRLEYEPPKAAAPSLGSLTWTAFVDRIDYADGATLGG